MRISSKLDNVVKEGGSALNNEVAKNVILTNGRVPLFILGMPGTYTYCKPATEQSRRNSDDAVATQDNGWLTRVASQSRVMTACGCERSSTTQLLLRRGVVVLHLVCGAVLML